MSDGWIKRLNKNNYQHIHVTKFLRISVSGTKKWNKINLKNWFTNIPWPLINQLGSFYILEGKVLSKIYIFGGVFIFSKTPKVFFKAFSFKKRRKVFVFVFLQQGGSWFSNKGFNMKKTKHFRYKPLPSFNLSRCYKKLSDFNAKFQTEL